jgi:DNA modification methylase
MEEIKLMQGDCLELMKGIPDNSVDLVVTDCPYTIVAGGVSGKRDDNCGGSGFAKYLEHFEGHEKCAVCKLTTNHRGWLSTYADQLEE